MTDSVRPLAVVTGASTGIGYELARLCAENGFDLLIAADEPRINEAAAELRRSGAAVEAIEVDLATMEGNERLYAAAGGRPVDALLANAGRVFLEEARATLHQAGRAVELARRAERGESGRLAVGFIDAAIYSVVPAVAGRFAERYPGVELALTELRIPEQVLAVAERRLDVGFVHPPVDNPELATETVLLEPLVVALPARHRLAAEARIELAALAREPLVQFPRAINPSLYDEIIGLCREAGFSPHIIREASPKQTVVGLVSAGLGVSLLPACLENLRRPGVAYRPLVGSNLAIDTSLVWRKGETSPTVRAFIETVRSVRAVPAG